MFHLEGNLLFLPRSGGGGFIVHDSAWIGNFSTSIPSRLIGSATILALHYCLERVTSIQVGIDDSVSLQMAARDVPWPQLLVR